MIWNYCLDKGNENVQEETSFHCLLVYAKENKKATNIKRSIGHD